MTAKSFKVSLQDRMLNKTTLKLTLLVVRGVDPSDGQNIHRKVLLTQLFRVAVLKLKFLSPGTSVSMHALYIFPVDILAQISTI